MPKANVHTASRAQLVEAGVRAELADEILKRRRKGKIAGAEALAELPGVGPATLDQLQKALDFSDQGGNGDDRGRDDEQPARAMAETARGAARAGVEAAETVSGGLRVVQQVAEAELAVAQRSVEGTAELGRALVDLLGEQTRHNLETWRALGATVDWGRAAQAIDWERVLQLQGEFWRVSLERAARLTQRYLEVSQAVMTASADAAQDQAKKAA